MMHLGAVKVLSVLFSDLFTLFNCENHTSGLVTNWHALLVWALQTAGQIELDGIRFDLLCQTNSPSESVIPSSVKLLRFSWRS